TEVSFLGYPDGRLTASLAVRRDITREIRRVRPDRVLCPSPERDYDRIRASHPDHLAAGEAAMCAVYPDARNPYAYPELLEQEGLEPFEVGEVWMMAGRSPDRFVDITARIDAKIAALWCHRTQISAPDEISQMIREWALHNGEVAGLPAGTMAEAFQFVDTH
ncbi:MAG: PIG-L deacetylase family protein, partial [Acidimicrobiales bacterium]